VSSQYFRFGARAAEPRRCAFLEQLLARADAGRPVSDWRAEAFQVIAPQAAMVPGIAPVALCADNAAADGVAADGVAADGASVDGVATHGADADGIAAAAADGAWVCLATPVHYLAEMTTVRLSQDGILSMSRTDAETLARDFNRVWNGSGMRLTARGSARLYCLFDQSLHVTTHDPQDVLDRHIEEYLPVGADAPRLRRLMSELEMWLFEHVINDARVSLSLPRISGLWLWGGGAPLASLPRVQGWVAGDDVFFGAFGSSMAEKSHSGERSHGGEKSDSGEITNCGVIVSSQTPGSAGWYDMEWRWLKPAVAQMRAGRLSQLQISAGERCFTLTARGLRRFWRRRKPWWESFA